MAVASNNHLTQETEGSMTKSLVIICSLHASPRSEELLRSLGKFSKCSTINFRDIHTGYEIARDIDAVILGGSKARIVDPCHRELFKTTTNLINHTDLPMLGICYGHQLLCWSLGANVSSLREPVKEVFEKVRVLKVDEIFQDFEEGSTIPLAQSHHDYVKRSALEQADIALLADSPSCEVEAVKHRYRPFYGVQFHPERIEINGETHSEGNKIIENFYRNVVKR